MQDPEAYLRAMTAPLAGAREGSPYPVARLSLEAVANAFVVLGLLPAARAEEILAARWPALEAAGFRVGREIGELSVNPGTRSFQEARAAALDSPGRIPLAVAAGGSVLVRPAEPDRPRGHLSPGRGPDRRKDLASARTAPLRHADHRGGRRRRARHMGCRQRP